MKRWEIQRAWVWAGGPAPIGVQRLFERGKEYSATPGLVDLDEALEDGFEPLAFVPSSSAYGGYMLLRKEREA